MSCDLPGSGAKSGPSCGLADLTPVARHLGENGLMAASPPLNAADATSGARRRGTLTRKSLAEAGPSRSMNPHRKQSDKQASAPGTPVVQTGTVSALCRADAVPPHADTTAARIATAPHQRKHELDGSYKNTQWSQSVVQSCTSGGPSTDGLQSPSSRSGPPELTLSQAEAQTSAMQRRDERRGARQDRAHPAAHRPVSLKSARLDGFYRAHPSLLFEPISSIIGE